MHTFYCVFTCHAPKGIKKYTRTVRVPKVCVCTFKCIISQCSQNLGEEISGKVMSVPGVLKCTLR